MCHCGRCHNDVMCNLRGFPPVVMYVPGLVPAVLATGLVTATGFLGDTTGYIHTNDHFGLYREVFLSSKVKCIH